MENSLNIVPPHKRQSPSNSIPNIDSLEGVGNDDSDEYSTLKRLQRHLECGDTPPLMTDVLNNFLDISTCRRSISKMNKGRGAPE